MLKLTTLVMAVVLLVFSIVFPQTAPVKHLAGKSETGQPDLYWFGAAAEQVDFIFDDGSSELFAYVGEPFANNQALVRFDFPQPVPPPPKLLIEISAFLAPRNPSDTASYFAFSIRSSTGTAVPGALLFIDTLTVKWSGQSNEWVKKDLALLLANGSNFWIDLNWLSDTPTNPLLGRDHSGAGFDSYVCYSDSCFRPFLGNWMMRAKTLLNSPGMEFADSFWVYRGTDSSSTFHIGSVDSFTFNFVDTPPSGGDYYYRVSRWDNDLESPLSNAILLSASPTSVKNREENQSVFLLSEPLPNPFSIGVLFTTRTEKQMELGFSIYNLLGQKVVSQSPQTFSAGEHRFHWRGEDASGTKLPSGAYFLRFQAGEEIIVKKLLLLR